MDIAELNRRDSQTERLLMPKVRVVYVSVSIKALVDPRVKLLHLILHSYTDYSEKDSFDSANKLFSYTNVT